MTAFGSTDRVRASPKENSQAVKGADVKLSTPTLKPCSCRASCREALAVMPIAQQATVYKIQWRIAVCSLTHWRVISWRELLKYLVLYRKTHSFQVCSLVFSVYMCALWLPIEMHFLTRKRFFRKLYSQFFISILGSSITAGNTWFKVPTISALTVLSTEVIAKITSIAPVYG